MKPLEGRKMRFGDRKDGFLVRNSDPMTLLIPYIMKERSDSWVLYDQKVDITNVVEFVRQHRRSDLEGLTLYHVLFAAIVRMTSQVPEVNRFVAGNRIYARNEVKISMVVKRGMEQDSDRSVIMPRFELDATLPEVMEIMKKEIDQINITEKSVELDTDKGSFDILQTTLAHVPPFILRIAMYWIRWLDRHNLLPYPLVRLSPFHSSFFITNMGSFGMDAVMHHCYNFGTLSVFGALGNKSMEYVMQKDGTTKKKYFLNMKFVVDERITEGFIYGNAFAELLKAIRHPETLMERPAQVRQDVIDR